MTALSSRAQVFSFPKIAKTGKNLLSFIPSGWKIKDKAIGDLNNDISQDAAIVLEYNAAIAELRPDSTHNLGHPRILIILLKTGSRYNLALQNNTFILRDGEGGMAIDPYDKMKITKGILNINVEFLHEYLNYKFRYQDNDFYLIGVSDKGGSLITGFESREYNFLTKKFVYKSSGTGGESKDNDKEELRDIHIPRLKKLSELLKPYSWHVFEDESI